MLKCLLRAIHLVGVYRFLVERMSYLLRSTIRHGIFMNIIGVIAFFVCCI